VNIEKIKQLASWGDLLAVQELITQLEETKADLAHANSILIKIEKLIEGVEYRGDFAEGVRVLKDSLEAAEKANESAASIINGLDAQNLEQAAQISRLLLELDNLESDR